MARINCKRLYLHDDERPVWWKTDARVKIHKYGSNEDSFLLAPAGDNPRNEKVAGISTIWGNNKTIYSNWFKKNGDYVVQAHDGDALVVYPAGKDEVPNNGDAPSSDDLELDIDPFNPNVSNFDYLLWLRHQLTRAIKSGRVPQGLSGAVQKAQDLSEIIIDTKKKEDKAKTLPNPNEQQTAIRVLPDKDRPTETQFAQETPAVEEPINQPNTKTKFDIDELLETIRQK